MTNNKLRIKEKINKPSIRKMALNHSYWEKNAKKYKSSHCISWGDINMINLEIKNILKYIKDDDHVLDAGCSNGYTTFKIASERKIKIRAFDYSMRSISYAKKSQKIKDKDKKIEFYHGNILNIDEKSNYFDKVYTIRVIINILSWDMQKKAIQEMHRVLKPGGLCLFSEAFTGSLKKINNLRKQADLPPLTMHNFNLYLDEKKFEKFIVRYFEIIEVKKFSSIYYVASRFLRYLTLKNNEKDSFVNPINNFFAQFIETDSSGDFGIQKLYVLRKK